MTKPTLEPTPALAVAAAILTIVVRLDHKNQSTGETAGASRASAAVLNVSPILA